MNKISKNNTAKLLRTVVDGIREKKGKNITVIDLRDLDDVICDYMVIAEGNTATQVEAIEGSVSYMVKEKLNERPVHQHKGSGEWIAIDYADVILHIFVPNLRAYYNIEGLWADAKIEQLPDEE